MEVFGDPGNNVLFLNGLVQKMKEGGQYVVVVIKERLEVMKMLERVVLSEEMERKKAAKKLMTKEEKSISSDIVHMSPKVCKVYYTFFRTKLINILCITKTIVSQCTKLYAF